MKKSKLKSLLKVITEEVVNIKEEAKYAEPNIPAEHQELWDYYKNRLVFHDWHPEYSDDPGASGRAAADRKVIDGMRDKLTAAGLGDEAKKIYDFAAAGNVRKITLKENKGLSGFKKSKESTEHTEKVADAKSLTKSSEPKEKKEGKKLPVVKKPANPQKVGSLKEDILQMIREEIDEMARVKGAVGSKFKVQDPNSPTGWVVKGHKTIPDGTPTEAPKGPYVKQGKNPNLGRPTTSPAASTATGTKAEIARTEDAVEEFVKYNPNATEQEVVDAIAEKNSEETPLSMDPSVIQNAMQNAKTDTGVETDTAEPDIANLAASEKAAKQAKMNRLRAYLMKKKGLKQ